MHNGTAASFGGRVGQNMGTEDRDPQVQHSKNQNDEHGQDERHFNQGGSAAAVLLFRGLAALSTDRDWQVN